MRVFVVTAVLLLAATVCAVEVSYDDKDDVDIFMSSDEPQTFASMLDAMDESRDDAAALQAAAAISSELGDTAHKRFRRTTRRRKIVRRRRTVTRRKRRKSDGTSKYYLKKINKMRRKQQRRYRSGRRQRKERKAAAKRRRNRKGLAGSRRVRNMKAREFPGRVPRIPRALRPFVRGLTLKITHGLRINSRAGYLRTKRKVYSLVREGRNAEYILRSMVSHAVNRGRTSREKLSSRIRRGTITDAEWKNFLAAGKFIKPMPPILEKSRSDDKYVPQPGYMARGSPRKSTKKQSEQKKRVKQAKKDKKKKKNKKKKGSKKRAVNKKRRRSRRRTRRRRTRRRRRARRS